MKVIVCPADRGGCGHYRLIWPARSLGHHVLAQDEKLTRAEMVDTPDGERVLSLEPVDADVVVMQRALYSTTAQMIPFLQAQGIAVVVDVDDDFLRIDPGNLAAAMCDPRTSPHRNGQILFEACQMADLVTVSTPALAKRFAPHGRVAVLPNCVPGRYLHIEREQWQIGKKVRVGWSGSVDTHPGDLASTRGGVGDALHGGLATFHVIGTGKGVRYELGLVKEPSATGWVELDAYPGALSALDVGIVALKACAFNRAKSWLKGLEMAAVGAAFVASPTPEYERLAKLGAGVLAQGPKEWRREVSRLITDTGWRHELRARGLAVARTLTIEANAWQWEAAWTQARALRLAA